MSLAWFIIGFPISRNCIVNFINQNEVCMHMFQEFKYYDSVIIFVSDVFHAITAQAG